MGTRLTDLPGGVLIPSRCTLSTLAANTGASTTSDYTESTPRPGSAVPGDSRNRLRAEVSNAQGASLDLRVIHAGMPGLEKACSLGYKLSTDTDANDWRGWNPPNWIEGWIPLDWSTSVDFQRSDICTIPSTQTAVVVRRRSDTDVAGSYTIDPDDWSVSALSTTTMPAGSTWNYPAICVLPGSERLLCLYGGVMYYSDDQGTTWSVYSEFPIDATMTTYQRARMGYYRGQILLLIEDSTAGTVHQYASSDLGSTFSLVETLAGLGDDVSVVPTPTALVVIYRDDTAAAMQISARRIGSPFEPLSRVATEEVAAGLSSDVIAACADPDGTIWAFIREESSQVCRCYVSFDTGASWDICDAFYDSGSSADYVTSFSVTSAAGRCLLAHSFVADTATYDGSLALFVLGGWSTVTTSPGTAATSWEYGKRFGSAATYSSMVSTTWLPIELPSDGGGWTSAGAGTSALTATGEMNISTSGNTSYHTRSLAAGGGHVVFAQLRVNSGGAAATSDVVLRGVVADGTDDWEWRINFLTTGFRIRDENGAATLANVTVDMTAWVQVLVECTEAGVVTVWHRTPGATNWTRDTSEQQLTTDNATPAANGGIWWGHFASGTADSDWRILCHQRYGGSGNPRMNTGVSNVLGRFLSAVPVPILDASDSAGRACHIAAAGGPARFGDGITVTVEHDYPIDNVFPEIAPSPDVKWRSTDTAEQILCFDLGAETWLGSAVGLFVAGANFRTAYLEYWTGAAWTTAGTLDLADGFNGSSRTYARTGDVIYPNSGSADGGRYLFENELVGGSHYFAAGGGTVRRVLANSGGGWADATTSIPHVRLDGIDGTEDASGNLILWTSRGLLVVYPTSQQRRRYWRVRIPTQVVAESYFECGTILVGRIQPWGARVDWTRSDEWIPNVQTIRDSHGTSRVRELGPLARTWSVSWQDAVHHRYLRSGVDLDYHGVSGALPLVAQDDVGMLLAGLLRETRSGEIPVVVIEELPTATGVLTDPTRYLYSRLVSSVRMNGVVGTLGTDEIYRVEGITFEEVV